MRLLFATTNPHKVREVAQVLGPSGAEVVSLDSVSGEPPEPEETEDSFMGNARLKARAYAAWSGLPCLAEDSGLEVDALAGAPGVHSARFSGEGGPRAERDRMNNDKLLAALQGVPEAQRAARFVCAMCLANPDGSIVAESTGRYEGRIALQPAGENGFGYDPLLYLPDVGCTSAQLSPEAKNARSHRGQAAREMALLLHHLGWGTG
jgi:XTP/dITP diphosphohydrolase